MKEAGRDQNTGTKLLKRTSVAIIRIYIIYISIGVFVRRILDFERTLRLIKGFEINAFRGQ